MKRILLPLLLLGPCLLFAQTQRSLKLAPDQSIRFGEPKTAQVRHLNDNGLDGNQNNDVSVPPSSSILAELNPGITVYDLQSNGSMGPRVHNWGNGEVSTTWCMSRTGSEAAGFSDRGTGYNKTAGGVFGPIPTTRIEGAATRTGAPSYFVTDAGEEWVFSHGGGLGAFTIHYAHKAASATTWTQGNVPITVPKGGLWARACAGGADGNSIHVIYYTNPTGTAFGGEPVEGIDGMVKYCRSTDGGQTWDKIDITLPGITSDVYKSMSAEGYAIDANGDNVAIALFSQTNDCLLYKSTDNGNTWSNPRVVNDFPLTKWSFDDGYTFDEVGMLYDSTYYPDSLALLTTDETGTVLVDDNGLAHVWFSSLFVKDADTTNNSTFTWWPIYDLGIIYWNETMADNSGVIAGTSPDINDDNVWGDEENNPLTLDNIYTDGYGDAFSTGPTAGIDAEGRLYLAFTSNHESYYDLVDLFYHKHPFIARTAPGDFTAWQEAQPVLTDLTFSDPSVLGFWEHYFTVMARDVDDHAHVLVQQDGGFGINARIAGNQPAEDNNLLYVAYPLSMFPLAANEPKVQAINLQIAPNPAGNFARLQFDSENNGTALVEVFDLFGSRVHMQRNSVGTGAQSIQFGTEQWPSGTYVVRVTNGRQSGAAKLIKL